MNNTKNVSLVDIQNNDKMIEFLIFDVGGIRGGIDILEIEGINWVPEITPVYGAPDYVKGLLNQRGQVVTVFDLGKRLGLDECQQTKQSRIVLIKFGIEYIGLLVDAITEVVVSPAKDVKPPPGNSMDVQGAFFSGILKKGNKLIALLNVDEILNNID